MEAKVEAFQTKKRRIPVPALVAVVWIGIYLFLKFFVKPPLPSSLIFMYMTLITVGLSIAVSINEGVLRGFVNPVVDFLRGDRFPGWHWRASRWVLLAAIPLYVSYIVYQQVMPRLEPPIGSRVIHPAPPPEVAALYNEFRDDEENLKQYIREGRTIYYQNCFYCHGDALTGDGPFAHGINPPPANFQDPGTIAQLTESFVFWRVSTGGPGLPDESTPWDSFMPRWEKMLTAEERWKVILFLYDYTGWSPRTWEEAGETIEEAEQGEKGPKKQDELEAGRMIYEKRCAPCHGEKGAGDGPAAGFVMPRPRDFTSGMYKFRSTPSGLPPTDEDLIHTIRVGLPGTSMPGWPQFTDAEVKALARYIQGFAPGTFQTEEKPKPIQIGTPPKASSKLIEEGKAEFQEAKCWECHGKEGRGDGDKARDPDFKDDWGHRIFPRNLTHSWEYRGGAAVEDIYRSITAGLDGTPMASFQDSLPDKDRWALAHYVKSLQVERRVGITLGAKRVKELPSDPNDPLWDRADYLDVPLVGQVVMEPRMFTPRVDNVRVQAVYNDKDVAFRLTWDDSTASLPGKIEAQAGGEGLIFEDAIAMQFPVRIPSGSKKPYFLMGEEGNPVILWKWRSDDPGSAMVLAGQGMDHLVPQPSPKQALTGKGIYHDGQYRVIVKRSLSTLEEDDLRFEVGKFTPIALFAWDGSNNENGAKCSLSSWYYLLLKPPTPVTVYLYPFLGILAVGGAEWWFIRRIRKNKGART